MKKLIAGGNNNLAKDQSYLLRIIKFLQIMVVAFLGEVGNIKIYRDKKEN